MTDVTGKVRELTVKLIDTTKSHRSGEADYKQLRDLLTYAETVRAAVERVRQPPDELLEAKLELDAAIAHASSAVRHSAYKARTRADQRPTGFRHGGEA